MSEISRFFYHFVDFLTRHTQNEERVQTLQQSVPGRQWMFCFTAESEIQQ